MMLDDKRVNKSSRRPRRGHAVCAAKSVTSEGSGLKAVTGVGGVSPPPGGRMSHGFHSVKQRFVVTVWRLMGNGVQF